MNDIPDFAEALTQFRLLLGDNGHPSDLFWVFRDDVWKLSPTEVWVKYPSSPQNIGLAEIVFAEGREKGLVEIHAFAVAAGHVAATVLVSEVRERRCSGLESRNETFYFAASAARKNNWSAALVTTQVYAALPAISESGYVHRHDRVGRRITKPCG